MDGQSGTANVLQQKPIAVNPAEESSNPWGNVIKKRSRLEMEKEQAKLRAEQAADEKNEQMTVEAVSA